MRQASLGLDQLPAERDLFIVPQLAPCRQFPALGSLADARSGLDARGVLPDPSMTLTGAPRGTASRPTHDPDGRCRGDHWQASSAG
jgi:hypothetical protein